MSESVKVERSESKRYAYGNSSVEYRPHADKDYRVKVELGIGQVGSLAELYALRACISEMLDNLEDDHLTALFDANANGGTDRLMRDLGGAA